MNAGGALLKNTGRRSSSLGNRIYIYIYMIRDRELNVGKLNITQGKKVQRKRRTQPEQGITIEVLTINGRQKKKLLSWPCKRKIRRLSRRNKRRRPYCVRSIRQNRQYSWHTACQTTSQICRRRMNFGDTSYQYASTPVRHQDSQSWDWTTDTN